MDRIKQISRLKVVEQTIEDLKNYRVGIDTSYFKEGKMELEINTDDFQYKTDYNNVNVEFDKKLMLNFIDSQIETLESESKSIFRSLTNEN